MQSGLARISRLAGELPRAVGRVTILFTSTLALFGGFGYGVGVRLEQVNRFDEIHPANFRTGRPPDRLQYPDGSEL